MLSGKRPALLFIIGGGLNYISAVLAERYPHVTHISLQPSDDFLGHEVHTSSLNWHPSSQLSLDETIRQAIAGNKLAGGVLVIEWPPVVTHYQEISGWIRSTLRDILEEASSNAATTGFWAARWLANSVRFVTSVTNTARLDPGTSPVAIACAGPSLSEFVPELLRMRSGMALWALASAVPALLRYGLVPDLVLATDPGFWNGAHLRGAFFRNIPIAMPPSSYASCGILHKSTIIPVDTGLSFEIAAIKAAGTGYEVALASGSAAGTALSLALRLTSGPIMLVGYDLAARGLLDHVQPYAFDILDEKSEGRLSPVNSVRAARVFEHYPFKSGEWRLSRAFATYADMIRVSGHDSTRVFRLASSSVETPIRRAVFKDIPFAAGTTPKYVESVIGGNPSPSARDEAVRAMLESLSDAAFDQANSAIKNSIPIPHDAALYFKALAPRASARLIADAARGEARLEDVMLAISSARETAATRLRCRAC
jgi:hypothetical protein